MFRILRYATQASRVNSIFHSHCPNYVSAFSPHDQPLGIQIFSLSKTGNILCAFENSLDVETLEMLSDSEIAALIRIR